MDCQLPAPWGGAAATKISASAVLSVRTMLCCQCMPEDYKACLAEVPRLLGVVVVEVAEFGVPTATSRTRQRVSRSWKLRACIVVSKIRVFLLDVL